MARAGTARPRNGPAPRSPSTAASTWPNTMPTRPAPSSWKLATEPPVTSAVALMPGMPRER
jgi:hypothetical protein